MSLALYNIDIDDLKLVRKGKVREVFDLGESLLIVATDRISAFDVIMNEPIPEKGKILNQISTYWLNSTKHIINNHLIASDFSDFPDSLSAHKEILSKRSMIVRKAKPLPVEFIVRGYVAGSGWKSYQESGKICGIEIPVGLRKFEQLPEPIFTPSTKADEGHDENISYEQCCEILGQKTTDMLKAISIELYNFGAERLAKSGILLADTKFEFGELETGEIILIDEALTPDSSRLWLEETYQPGEEPQNYDKQILRDYLETLDWDKTPPAPMLPDNVINKINAKYLEAYYKITGTQFVG
ncbi:MAG: phosphoribosylaminoimidazolesuccinocarboxamide synthase [Ignavibacteriae bacterium HGW-Ignavibacteriae-1]|jgi:phosphoribosylaminoimidazole-succinocarboxamide synthase|nr:MAG: phosphoribosylaminoimidazolesuccinocarboxamide synthase [Ignavibacteriae bacterium HGW-Ignavibacteriae-1]